MTFKFTCKIFLCVYKLLILYSETCIMWQIHNAWKKYFQWPKFIYADKIAYLIQWNLYYVESSWCLNNVFSLTKNNYKLTCKFCSVFLICLSHTVKPVLCGKFIMPLTKINYKLTCKFCSEFLNCLSHTVKPILRGKLICRFLSKIAFLIQWNL